MKLQSKQVADYVQELVALPRDGVSDDTHKAITEVLWLHEMDWHDILEEQRWREDASRLLKQAYAEIKAHDEQEAAEEALVNYWERRLIEGKRRKTFRKGPSARKATATSAPKIERFYGSKVLTDNQPQ